MPSASRVLSVALAVFALALAGCGSSHRDAGDAAATPVGAPAPPSASGGLTDGRTGPAVTATNGQPPHELSAGGRVDSSEPRSERQLRDGIGAGDACPQVDLPPTAGNLARIEATTLCLLNGVRADGGLQPLRLNSTLAGAALSHSKDMVAKSYFAHQGSNGSEVKDRISATGYLPRNAGWTIGENLAWGTGALGTPKAIMNAWMNSKGHRDNIMHPAYRDIGFGIVAGNPQNRDGSGATYATEFGVRGKPGVTATARRARASRARARRAQARRAAAGSASGQ